jgi:hypothetical protein
MQDNGRDRSSGTISNIRKILLRLVPQRAQICWRQILRPCLASKVKFSKNKKKILRPTPIPHTSCKISVTTSLRFPKIQMRSSFIYLFDNNIPPSSLVRQLVHIDDWPNVLDKVTFPFQQKKSQSQNYGKRNSNVDNRNRCKGLWAKACTPSQLLVTT